jgi:hypothetical protein
MEILEDIITSQRDVPDVPKLGNLDDVGGVAEVCVTVSVTVGVCCLTSLSSGALNELLIF